jgi:hypothetical protein
MGGSEGTVGAGAVQLLLLACRASVWSPSLSVPDMGRWFWSVWVAVEAAYFWVACGPALYLGLLFRSAVGGLQLVCYSPFSVQSTVWIACWRQPKIFTYHTVVLQPVVRKCTEMLSRAICISGGDFYVRRFHKDGPIVWRLLALSPFRRLSKMDEKAIILPYRDTSLNSEEPMAEISSQKIQIAVLDMIAAISSNKRSVVALESVLKKVCGLVVGIAYSSLTGLQEATIRALAGLACMDADLVWLLLADVYYSLNQRESLLPDQDLALVSDLLPPQVSSREYLCTVWR